MQKINIMDPNKGNQTNLRYGIVLGGGAFILLLIILAKTVGDVPFISCIAIVGWIVLMCASITYFTNRSK